MAATAAISGDSNKQTATNESETASRRKYSFMKEKKKFLLFYSKFYNISSTNG